MLSQKRRCPGCRHELGSNAFPRGSRRCYACRDDRRKKEARERMPPALGALRDRLDEIERDNAWEHQFITHLVERFESGRAKSLDGLTPKQRAKLDEIYRKYEDSDATT